MFSSKLLAAFGRRTPADRFSVASLLCAGLALLPLMTFAQTAPPESLLAGSSSTVPYDPAPTEPEAPGLPEDVERMLARHPALLAVRSRTDRYRESAHAALALPDPQLGLGINNLPYEDPSLSRYLPTNTALSFSQQIPSRARRQAAHRQEIARAEHSSALESAIYDQLLGELLASWHERELTESKQALARARKEKYEELQAAIEATIESGEGTVYRLAQIAVEAAAVDSELAALEGQRFEVEAKLKQLVMESPGGPPPPVLLETWSGEATRFHAVGLALADQRLAARGVERAEAAWHPDWSAELTYQHRQSGMSDNGVAFDGDDWISAKVSLTIPLWASASQSPTLRAAQAEALSADFEVADALRTALARYESLGARHAAALQNEIALKSQRDAIEEQFESQLSAFEAGGGSFAELVDAEIAMLRLEAAILQARTDATVAAARMNALQVSP